MLVVGGTGVGHWGCVGIYIRTATRTGFWRRRLTKGHERQPSLSDRRNFLVGRDNLSTGTVTLFESITSLPSQVIIKQSTNIINAQHMALAFDNAHWQPNRFTEVEYTLRAALPVF